MIASLESNSENDETPSKEVRKNMFSENPSVSSATKKCKVCGDRAVGCNFSVITCESCKAFFRRNANREKELPKCAFKNECQINVRSRRFCQLCRLNKCIQVGMKREWITNENYRRCKKPRLTIIPEKTEELNKMLEEFGNTEVTLSVDALKQLVQKTNYAPRPQFCQCKCTCGYYPSNTPLTAASDAKQPSKTEVANAASTSNETTHDFAQPATTFNSLNAVSQQYIPQCNYNWQEPSVSNYHNNPACITQIWNESTTKSSSLSNFPPGFEQPPLINAMSATIHSEYGVGPMPNTASKFNSNSILSTKKKPKNLRMHSEVLPNRTYQTPQAIQPQEWFVTLNEYSRMLNTDGQATDNQSSILELPKGLDDNERFLLQELILANRILTQPLDFKINSQAAEDITLTDVARVTDLALRRIIKMAKELSYFRELSTEDQIALLRGSGSELLILRGVMVFNPSKHVWDYNKKQGNSSVKIKLDILKCAKENQHYEEHKKFLETFSERWRENDNVMLLLSAIVLFCPDRPNIEKRDIVMRNHLQYYSLLKRYIRLQCSNDIEADEAYDMLRRKVVDLHQLSQSMMRVYYGLNVKEMGPTVNELFELDRIKPMSTSNNDLNKKMQEQARY